MHRDIKHSRFIIGIRYTPSLEIDFDIASIVDCVPIVFYVLILRINDSIFLPFGNVEFSLVGLINAKLNESSIISYYDSLIAIAD